MKERIDLTQLETQYAEHFKDAQRATKNACMDFQLEYEMMNLMAELKKMYEREDALVSAIKELCDSEDSTGCSGDLTVVSLDPMLKLYELTSE